MSLLEKTHSLGARPGLPPEPGPQRSDRSVRRSAGDAPPLTVPGLAAAKDEAVDSATLMKEEEAKRRKLEERRGRHRRQALRQEFVVLLAGRPSRNPGSTRSLRSWNGATPRPQPLLLPRSPEGKGGRDGLCSASPHDASSTCSGSTGYCLLVPAHATVVGARAVRSWILNSTSTHPCILQSLVRCRVPLVENRFLDSGRRLQFRIRRLLRQWIRLFRQFWGLWTNYHFSP